MKAVTEASITRKFASIIGGSSALYGLTLPVFYLMVVGKGRTLHELGLLVTVSTVTALLVEVPSGALSDRIGRKRVFLVAEAFLLASNALFVMVDSFGGLLAASILGGIARAMFTGTLDTLFVEQLLKAGKGDAESSSSLLNRGQATVGSVAYFALGLSAVVGGLLPMWTGPLTEHWSWLGRYEVNCAVVVPLSLLHMILTAWAVDEGPRADKSQAATTVAQVGAQISASLGIVATKPALIILLALQFVAGLTVVSVDVLWQPRLAELIDADRYTWIFGLLTSAAFVCAAVGHSASVKVGKFFKHHATRMLFAVEALTALVFLLFAYQAQTVLFCAGYCLLMMLSGMSKPPALTLFHELATDDQRSTLASIRSTCEQCGAAAGALLASVLSEYAGISSVWAGAAFLTLAGAFIYRMSAVESESLRLSGDPEASTPNPLGGA